MAHVYIPPNLRSLTGGHEIVEVDGATVREIIDGLESLHPGTKAQLCRGEQLRPGLVVAVNSSVTTSGMRERVATDAEVHFLPAIGGG